jgi:hypothetical protein
LSVIPAGAPALLQQARIVSEFDFLVRDPQVLLQRLRLGCQRERQFHLIFPNLLVDSSRLSKMNQQKVGNVYQNPMKNYRRFAEQHLFEIKKNSDLSSMDMMNLLIDTKHCDN